MDSAPPRFAIVPFAVEYAAGVPEVVRQACIEYGFTWNSSAYFNDLHDPQTYYIAPGGMFWLFLDGQHVIGTLGVTPHGVRECEMHRLYLLAEYRGRRFGQRLLDTSMAWARAQGLRRMILWSDVKLTHAHALYRANGFVPSGER